MSDWREISTRNCYFCGKIVKCTIPYYSHCSKECELERIINNGAILIGDNPSVIYMDELRRSIATGVRI